MQNMQKNTLLIIAIAIVVLFNYRLMLAGPPRVPDTRYKLELIAQEPQIVTPVGMAFDRKGQLLVVESHTHQPPEGYQGLKHDRIRMLSDSNGDGKLDQWSTFAEGFRHAMNILVGADGSVYLVTRHNLVVLRDTNGDGVADKQQELLRLETSDDYPHNGLGALAQDNDGNLIVSLAENHGEKYSLIGADGTTINSGGGQDGFYSISPKGENLKRFARGFWNPFSACVLPDGRIFTADNDPDASPPCRLVHVAPGGDYGFIYQYGRAGTHPLQCWNGELPGTLPMVCGVSEAPTAIVPHAGALWVTSWGDHRIERYELVSRGASYGAKRTIIVQGDGEFRPTGMAVAPDGSIYFADWVLHDYPVHGHGKIWRLTLPEGDAKKPLPPRSKEDLAASDDSGDAVQNVESPDPYLHTHGVNQLAHQKTFRLPAGASPRLRLGALEAAWHNRPADVPSLLRNALHDDSPEVRLFAVRWIADERITTLRNDVAKLLNGPQPNFRLYLAVLGAIDWLDHEPSQHTADFTEGLLVRELSNDNRSPEIHALTLSLLKPSNKFLTTERLAGYLRSDYTPLRLEAVRTLSAQSGEASWKLLAGIANDRSQPTNIRAEAIVGLSAGAEKYRELLEKFAASDDATLKHEAARALRLALLQPASTEAKPPAEDLEAWNKLLATPGDAESGRHLFFSPVGPRCSVCHSYAGRGAGIAPELTRISSVASRERIIASILQPSLEIAQDYQPWLVTTNDGKTYTGVRLGKASDSGEEDYVDTAGNVFTLPSPTIESRQPIDKSIMPDNFQSLLSIEDLRDLVTFLVSPGR